MHSLEYFKGRNILQENNNAFKLQVRTLKGGIVWMLKKRLPRIAGASDFININIELERIQ